MSPTSRTAPPTEISTHTHKRPCPPSVEEDFGWVEEDSGRVEDSGWVEDSGLVEDSGWFDGESWEEGSTAVALKTSKKGNQIGSLQNENPRTTYLYTI